MSTVHTHVPLGNALASCSVFTHAGLILIYLTPGEHTLTVYTIYSTHSMLYNVDVIKKKMTGFNSYCKQKKIHIAALLKTHRFLNQTHNYICFCLNVY